MAEERILSRKAICASLGLHFLCISAIFLFGSLVARHPETVRVLLTLDPPVAASGGGGTPGETAKKEPPAAAPAKRQKAERSHRTEKTNATTREVDRKVPARKVVTEQSRLPVAAQDILPVESAPLQQAAAGNAGVTEHADSPSRAVGTGGAGTGSGGGGGTGSGTGAGSLTGTGQGEPSAALKKQYLAEHFAYINELINKNITYPPMAKKLGWQGRVVVCFVIKENGKVDDLRVKKSSGYEVLDRNVIETIRTVQPFPKPPVSAELTIPVSYALR